MAKKILLAVIGGLFCINNAHEPGIKMVQITQVGDAPLNSRSIHVDWPRPVIHSYTIPITIAVGTYVATVTYVLHARYLLSNLSAWNNWKNTIPLAELASLPQKNVYDMLAKSIGIKYNCPPGTVQINLTQFLQDTTNEIETLSNYKSFANILKSLYIAPVFFISLDSIKQADEKIKRLRFMQSIVANELEPNNSVRRLEIINYAYRKCQSLMQRVLNRHH